MWDQSYCRASSQQTECDSRLGVKKQFELIRMEASSLVISENLSTERNPRDRSICFQIISSDHNLLFAETRSIESSNRCLPTKLVPLESLCFSPILHDPKGFEQSTQRQSTYDDRCARTWSPQLWYPAAMRVSIQQPILLTWRRDI